MAATSKGTALGQPTTRPLGRRRWIPPAGLAVVSVAIIVIVAGAGGASRTSASASASLTPLTQSRSHRHYWIVQPGQTLSSIASRMKLTLSQIERLNVGTDLTTLHPGELVRVRA